MPLVVQGVAGRDQRRNISRRVGGADEHAVEVSTARVCVRCIALAGHVVRRDGDGASVLVLLVAVNREQGHGLISFSG